MTEALDSKGHTKISPDFQRGLIMLISAAAVPSGWAICDGTNGTPDLTDRFVVGDTAVGTGTAGGTVSAATAALAHAGAAVGNHSDHVVTQPAAHSNHGVTQPAAHSNHAVTQAADHGQHAAASTHTHDAHGTGPTVNASTATIVAFTHNAQGSHQHVAHDSHVSGATDAHSAHASAALDAHSAHASAALDAHSAHSVTQPSDHAILKTYKLVYIMWMAQ